MASELKTPTPSHQRERSLDDIIYDSRGPSSIVSSPRTHRTSASSRPGSSQHHHMDVQTLIASNESLQKALEFEEMESQQLERQVKEQRSKLDSALIEQSRLEQDMVERDKTILRLQQELKQTKRSKHDLENQLSQEQMHYINEKQEWLDKEAEYEKKLQHLHEHGPPTPPLKDYPTPTSPPQQNKAPPPPPQPQGNNVVSQKVADRMKNELDVVKQQLELVSKEYSLRHEKLRDEADELRKLNERLMEENQGFQVLLAQKAVKGEFNLADELASAKEDEQDEEQENDNDDDENNNEEEDEEKRELRKRVYKLEFEVKSIQNHNRALKLSLERLVKRLLEYRDFEKVVETSDTQITPRTISLFHKRISSTQAHKPRSSSSTLHVPKHRTTPSENPPMTPTSPSGNSNYQFPRSANRALKPPSTWSSMIFSNSSSTTLTNSQQASQQQQPQQSNTPNSPASSIDTSTKSSASSSIDSITTGDDDVDIKSIISDQFNHNNLRRPSTNGQKRLRPLKLIPLEENDNSAPNTGTSWSFNIY
ncbi:hypothetical protein TRICI_000168 [Trichomonascus ciferrii]|uniref:Uncharacterized protein n=1 Tax=Trichomonascus ciferrii TaxID=44093 RepID=A0A642VE49_9ASCO|nr:hypothetical protein TRICI_000168 [Trichomonascus ciferrii]